MRRVLTAIVVPPHMAVSGAVRAAEELSRALAASCDVSIASMLAPPAGVGRTPSRIPVRVTLPMSFAFEALPRRFRTLFYRSNIASIVADRRYDLVHLHNPMPALEMARIARACRAIGKPYVLSTHGFNEVVNGNRIYGFGPVRRLIWRRFVIEPVMEVLAGSAGVFALSPADLPLLEALGHPAEDVTVVTNGVTMPVPGDPDRDARSLGRLGVSAKTPEAPICFMFLANHTPNKGLSVLFEALERLTIPFELILAGETRQGVRYDDVERQCRPCQRVVITGRLSDEEASACFRRADAFVFPSLADTLPLVVLEAMAHGLPVIASDVGGIPHQLANGCGINVPAGDAEALAGAMVRVAGDPVLRSRMGAAARERVASEFTWDSAAAVAATRYEQILTRRERDAAGIATFPSLVRRRAF